MKYSFALLAIFLAALSLIGCGGGGGGGANPVNNQPVGTTISQSATIRGLVAREFSDKFRALNSNYTALNANVLPALRALSETKPEVGKTLVTYGPEDVITLFGVSYTYTGGSQLFEYKDASGNLTDDKSKVHTIEITSTDLKCRFKDGDDSYSMVYQGKVVMSGLLDRNPARYVTDNLQVSATINAFHQIVWNVKCNIEVGLSTFPYPSKDSTESGSMIIDDRSYNYSVTYDGTANVSVSFNGPEVLVLKVDMGKGEVTDMLKSDLKTDYPQLYNAYAAMQTALQDNNKTVAERMALFSPNIADDFVDTAGNAGKKQDLIDLTSSRLERYTVNSYSFTPGSYKVVNADTIEVTTDMFIDVTRKPGAVGAVSAASIPLPGQTVIWKKYGSDWKIYKGIPYKSDEIGI